MGKFIAIALIVVAVLAVGTIALGNLQDGITSVTSNAQSELESAL